MVEGIRAHIGSGTVTLKGFVNVDTRESGANLSAERPEDKLFWETEEFGTDGRSAYYRRVDEIREKQPSEDRIRHHLLNPFREHLVCDRYGSFQRLPFADGECAEILAHQVFEHLSRDESKQAMEECRRALKIDGLLRLGVPDHEEAFRELRRLWTVGDETGASFMLSHIIGSAKHHWAFHMGSWTRGDLRAFVESYGFEFVAEEPSINFYPSFTLRWRKVEYDPQRHHPVHNLYEPRNKWKAAYNYAGIPIGRPIRVPDDWRCLEVGPGVEPWPRANYSCDIVPRDLPNFTLADAQALPYNDKSFEFCLISHVMEHVADPVKAASELSRVAHSGIIISPGPWKEGLFGFHEADHKWFVLPPGKNGALRFVPIDSAWRDKVLDPANDGSMLGVEYSKVAHQLLRLPNVALREFGDTGRRYFENAEPWLDVIHRWDANNSLKIEVLE